MELERRNKFNDFDLTEGYISSRLFASGTYGKNTTHFSVSIFTDVSGSLGRAPPLGTLRRAAEDEIEVVNTES